MWPCRCRRGGAYSLINTPVTRVKPPQARAAPATPRQRGQERGRRSGLAQRPDSPKLPAKPSIFREKSGSGAGGLREAPRTLRASVRVFTAETSRAASVPAEPPAGSAGPQTEDPPLRCGPKEQKWPREERDEPRSCRRTDRRACAFPTPPALAARASPGGAGGEQEPEEARVSEPLLPVQVLQRRPAGSPRHHMRAQESVPECS